MIKLNRTITFFQATALGLGALIGAGIFVLIGPAFELTGPYVVAVYFLAAFSAFLSALTYAELSSTYMIPGGAYAYLKKTMSEQWAFVIGWLLITGSTVACAVYAIGFSAFFANFLTIPGAIISLIITLGVCIINIVGVDKTVKMEFYFTLILCIALALLGIFMLFQSNPQYFNFSGYTNVPLKIIQGISLVYISFFGFQVISTSTSEIIHPKKNVPKAVLASSIIASIIYIIIAFGVLGVLGSTAGIENPANILEVAAANVWGSFGGRLITFLGIIATLTSLNATVHAVSRRVFVLAKDHYIPEQLAEIHPKFRTPYLAIGFIFVLIALLIMIDSLALVASLSAYAYLFSLALVHYALIRSRKIHPERKRGFRVPFFPAVPIIGIVINMAILVMLDTTILYTGIAWTMMAFVLFYILKQREQGFVNKFKLAFQRSVLWVKTRGKLQ